MAETSITIPNIRYVVDSGNPKPTPNLIPIAIPIPNPNPIPNPTLVTQILPRFTSCFAQLAEGVAPNGHSMESWLQDLTAEMQASIEKHLSKVFKEDG